jgi:hypothetical protein
MVNNESNHGQGRRDPDMEGNPNRVGNQTNQANWTWMWVIGIIVILVLLWALFAVW